MKKTIIFLLYLLSFNALAEATLFKNTPLTIVGKALKNKDKERIYSYFDIDYIKKHSVKDDLQIKTSITELFNSLTDTNNIEYKSGHISMIGDRAMGDVVSIYNKNKVITYNMTYYNDSWEIYDVLIDDKSIF